MSLLPRVAISHSRKGVRRLNTPPLTQQPGERTKQENLDLVGGDATCNVSFTCGKVGPIFGQI